MNERAKNLSVRQWTLFAFVLSLVLVANWWTTLFTGDGADIAEFRASIKPLSLSYVSHLLSPFWGWAYRPTILLYYSGALRLCGADPLTLHVISLVLHCVVIVLCLTLTRRLFKSDTLAALTAALFAAGTWNNQAVAWICSTSTLFAAIPYLLALHFWLSWRQFGRVRYYLAVLLCCIVAFASKEEAYTIPVAFLSVDYLRGIRDLRNLRKLWPYAPVAVVLAIFLVLAIIARNSINLNDAKIVTFAAHPTLSAPLATAQGSFLGFWESREFAINLWGLALIGSYCRRQGTAVFVLFWWTVLTAIPASFVANSTDTRFLYLPMLAGSMLVAHLVQSHWSHLRAFIAAPASRAIIAALGAGLLCAVFFSSAGDFDRTYSPTRELRYYLTYGFPLVPLVLCFCILAPYVLWKLNVLPRESLVALVLVAGGSQLGVWASSLPLNPVALLAPALAVLASHNRGWRNALMVVVLWELPALSLPFFLLCYGILTVYDRKTGSRAGFGRGEPATDPATSMVAGRQAPA